MRISLVHRFVAQAEPVHGARAEVLDEYVHLVDQAQTEIEAFRMLQVD